MNLLFYTGGAVAIVATFLVITRRNAVHALLYLILSLLSVALVFYSLGAAYVALLEIIIYAGAIMVLFLRRRGVPLFDRAIVTPSAAEVASPQPRPEPARQSMPWGRQP